MLTGSIGSQISLNQWTGGVFVHSISPSPQIRMRGINLPLPAQHSRFTIVDMFQPIYLFIEKPKSSPYYCRSRIFIVPH